MKISFIIPAYNEEAYLGKCLDALFAEINRSGAGIETEVIVVDNASTDTTATLAKSFTGVRVVHEPIQGPAQSRQTGFQEATGELIAFLDADTMPLQGWLSTIIREFSHDPHVVCISGPYFYYDLPLFWRTIAWPYEIVFGSVAHFLTGHCVTGGNMIIRRGALEAVGGFNTAIVFYGEDLDVGLRLRSVGKILYTAKLGVASSARRFNVEGVLTTTTLYAVNFLSQAIRKRPITASHKNIR